MPKQYKQNLVLLTVFSVSLIVVLITLIPVVFPYLLMGSFEEIPKYPTEINPFETGIWAFPLILGNLILLCIAVLYIKNRLPQPMIKTIKFIFNFETSTRVSFTVITILIIFYLSFNVEEIFMEDKWEDFEKVVKPALETYDVQNISEKPGRPHIVLILGTLSMNVFGTYRAIPLISSIALLFLTYFITSEISKKRFAGIVSMVIVMQSSTFQTYDTTITYSNFWILFYLLSLYTILKKWYLSPISYLLSIPSKAITALFLPMTLFFIYRADIIREQKKHLFISYGVIMSIAITAVFVVDLGIFQRIDEFNLHSFWSGFTALSSQFRFDGLIIIFLLPLIVGLFLASRKGIPHADSVLVLIIGILLLAPILPAITTFTNNPYRSLPIVIFFAMGVGTLLSSKLRKT